MSNECRRMTNTDRYFMDIAHTNEHLQHSLSIAFRMQLFCIGNVRLKVQAVGHKTSGLKFWLILNQMCRLIKQTIGLKCRIKC